ncbi:MAG: cation:dicarboxylase symporter family transporter [Francisellaceae bacterium]|jgi:Na+/H+-dicarboxylate symporter|nr:cation:dicarboxylase symporter family transporter [Francisellaceae bacterium]MBT6207394.1 cation:dicarboxylase symporter family transporter [Francisellaceae bacterium]MBT6539221.1 cation:dicarboxylase symporter family transporter [Francisellaceae bacterium]
MINKKYAAATYLLAILGAFATVHFQLTSLIEISEQISCWFVKFLKWISIPMIFLSVTSAAAGLNPKSSLSKLFSQLFKYTIFTTMLSAATALVLYLIIQPSLANAIDGNCTSSRMQISTSTYSICLIITLMSCALLSMIIRYYDAKQPLKKTKAFIISSYNAVMFVIRKFFMLLPFAIWAFIVEFIVDLNTIDMAQFTRYLSIIVLANLIQALITLPLILMAHRIKPLQLFKNLVPALSTAFWSKSSSVALPEAIRCSIDRAKMDPEVAKFSLPLCITLNMNACAAFILTTVLFISESNGVSFSPMMLCAWVVIATIAAIGNAGIPMGCYTLSGVILSYLGVPLVILGLILPFYSLIDMLESAINVWSDGCVTAILNKKNKEKKEVKI